MHSEGVGGRMACPGCGRTDYVIFEWVQVLCKNCGWVGEYSEMLFVKKMSQKGRERIRRE